VTRDVVSIASTEEVVVGGLTAALRTLVARGLNCHAYARLARRDQATLTATSSRAHLHFVESFATTGRCFRFGESGIEDLRVKESCGALLPEDLADLPSTGMVLALPALRGEIPLETLRRLAALAPLGVDLNGFVWMRNGDRGAKAAWEGLPEAMSLCCLVAAGAEEAMIATGTDTPENAARHLAALGPETVAISDRSRALLHVGQTLYTASMTSPVSHPNGTVAMIARVASAILRGDEGDLLVSAAADAQGFPFLDTTTPR